eukprot:4999845-Pyramimonas_sp.AAC.1
MHVRISCESCGTSEKAFRGHLVCFLGPFGCLRGVYWGVLEVPSGPLGGASGVSAGILVPWRGKRSRCQFVLLLLGRPGGLVGCLGAILVRHGIPWAVSTLSWT